MISVEQSVEWELAGETEVLGENLSQCHFAHHKSHMSWARSGGKPATNRLSYGTASTVCLVTGIQLDRVYVVPTCGFWWSAVKKVGLLGIIATAENHPVWIFIYLLTELSPFWEAANCAATEELPSILWNPKVHYRVHKSPPLVPILSQIDPYHPVLSLLRSILILFTHVRLGLIWISIAQKSGMGFPLKRKGAGTLHRCV
jgi:hypothetical protein